MGAVDLEERLVAAGEFAQLVKGLTQARPGLLLAPVAP
jgi:hypothetical protein